MQVHRMRRTGRRIAPIGVGRVGAGGVPVTTLYLAHFTGTNGTDLTAYTADVGTATWTNPVGFYTIQSNRASATAANALYVLDIGQSDVTVSATLNLSVDSANNGLVLRYTDTSNMFVAGFNSGSVSLTEINAGTPTTRISVVAGDISTGVDFTMSMVLSGQSISLYANGSLRGSYTSASFNQTATKFGLRRATGTTAFDDYTITKP